MRPLHALLHAMRKRRHRIDLTQADRLAAGDPPGSDHPGLGDLLDAARAPGTAEELAGEKAVVAVFTAHRKRAARWDRRALRKVARPRPEHPVTVGARGAPIGRAHRPKARAGVVTGAAGLALLAFGGTAVAARTGNLPEEAQQHAHRLFSALGVPAPRTGSPTPAPTTERPSPAPTATPSPEITALNWCTAWRAAPSGSPMNPGDRRKLRDAAGGEDRIEGYCDRLTSASPPPAGTSTPPSPNPSGTAEPSPTPSYSVPPRKGGRPTAPPARRPPPRSDKIGGPPDSLPPRRP